MNGLNYLLDSNIVIGFFNHLPAAQAIINDERITPSMCGYSSITRMEVLGYPGLTEAETAVIREFLARLVYLPVTREIEDMTIELRRSRRVKLPDAIIAATAKVHGLRLLTLDQDLSKTQ
jgi:predicted nucleic acid-binding protein